MVMGRGCICVLIGRLFIERCMDCFVVRAIAGTRVDGDETVAARDGAANTNSRYWRQERCFCLGLCRGC